MTAKAELLAGQQTQQSVSGSHERQQRQRSDRKCLEASTGAVCNAMLRSEDSEKAHCSGGAVPAGHAHM
eukprot:m.46666 g.46666  ORF g.46666 m.46666 type:complete len:69 (+) comp47445_c0_seq1:2661-2867(+)